MPYFVILARKEYGGKCIPLTQVRGEQHAVSVAHKIYKEGGMNRAMVVDEQLKVVFKLDRKCRCINAQYDMYGGLKCTDCGRVIKTNEVRVEEYQ